MCSSHRAMIVWAVTFTEPACGWKISSAPDAVCSTTLTGEEVHLSTPEEKLQNVFRGYASELERAKNSLRVRENHMLKARRGYHVGGKVYGYDTRPADDGTGWSMYVINDAEAAVVQEVFRQRAIGAGYRQIAIDLNDRGVPFPKVKKRGSGSWSMHQVRNLLQNERYCGVLIYGRYKKAYKGGTKIRVKMPSCDWVRVEKPELRIIDQTLWETVQALNTKRRATAGLQGRRGPNKYLLSGIARCGMCGGPISVDQKRHGNEPVKVYICSWHKDRGSAVCANSLRRPVREVDRGMIDWLEQHILREEYVVEALKEVRRRLKERSKNVGPEIKALEQERRKLKKEIEKPVMALTMTDKRPAPVIEAIDARSKRVTTIESRLEAAKVAPSTIDLETRRLEKDATARLEQLRRLLRGDSAKARNVVEALVEPGSLTMTPENDKGHRRYLVQGLVSPGTLLAGRNLPPSEEPDDNASSLRGRNVPNMFLLEGLVGDVVFL